jgi:twitching motility protein PilU
MDLSLNMRAIVAQQLIPTPDGNGRRACMEILLNTPLAQDLTRKGSVHELNELMKKSTELGMQTFDQALYELYDRGEITYEDALSYADSPNDLRLIIKLKSETDAEYLSHAADELTIQQDEKDSGRMF